MFHHQIFTISTRTKRLTVAIWIIFNYLEIYQITLERNKPHSPAKQKTENARERGTYRVIFTKWSFSSLFSSSIKSRSALNLLSISLRSSNRLLIRFVRFNFVFLSSSFSCASFANSALRICNSLS